MTILTLPIILLNMAFNPLMLQGDQLDMRALNTKAEAFMQKKQYVEAKEVFEEIVKKIDPPFVSSGKYKIDWLTYCDVIEHLAEAKCALQEFQEAEELLSHALSKHPPAQFLPALLTIQARLKTALGSPQEAYLLLSTIRKNLPLEKWRGPDRLFFHCLEYVLNDRIDEILQKGKRAIAIGDYPLAISLYQEIIAAIERKCYPQALLQEPLILKKADYHIAKAQYALASVAGAQEILALALEVYEKKLDYEEAVIHFQPTQMYKQKHYTASLFELAVAHLKATSPKADTYLELLYANERQAAEKLVQKKVSRSEEKPHKERARDASYDYFKDYSIDDYLQGKQAAIKHLRHFTTLFPESPLLVATHYLIGHSTSELSLAIASFEKALVAFDRFANKEEGLLKHFQAQSAFELGLLYLAEECPLKSAEYLIALTDYPPLYEESALALCACYLKLNFADQAKRTALALLDFYDKKEISEGKMIAKLWLQLGEIALREKEFESAQRCLKMASRVGLERPR